MHLILLPFQMEPMGDMSLHKFPMIVTCWISLHCWFMRRAKFTNGVNKNEIKVTDFQQFYVLNLKLEV